MTTRWTSLLRLDRHTAKPTHDEKTSFVLSPVTMHTLASRRLLVRSEQHLRQRQPGLPRPEDHPGGSPRLYSGTGGTLKVGCLMTGNKHCWHSCNDGGTLLTIAPRPPRSMRNLATEAILRVNERETKKHSNINDSITCCSRRPKRGALPGGRIPDEPWLRTHTRSSKLRRTRRWSLKVETQRSRRPDHRHTDGKGQRISLLSGGTSRMSV